MNWRRRWSLDTEHVKYLQTANMRFQFSRGYQLYTYFSIVLFLALAAVSLYVGILGRPTPNPNATAVVGIAVLFVLLGAYQISKLPRLRETIHITETGIVQERVNRPSILLAWSEIVTIRDRPFLGRLELLSNEPSRTIHIEYQIHDYGQLLEVLHRHLTMFKNSRG